MHQENSESGTERHDELPFDPAAAVCEELLVFVDQVDDDKTGDSLSPEGLSRTGAPPDDDTDELPDVTPVAASAVVDVEFVIDYDRELGYLRAEGRRGFSARPTGSRGRPAGPRAR